MKLSDHCKQSRDKEKKVERLLSLIDSSIQELKSERGNEIIGTHATDIPVTSVSLIEVEREEEATSLDGEVCSDCEEVKREGNHEIDEGPHDDSLSIDSTGKNSLSVELVKSQAQCQELREENRRLRDILQSLQSPSGEDQARRRGSTLMRKGTNENKNDYNHNFNNSSSGRDDDDDDDDDDNYSNTDFERRDALDMITSKIQSVLKQQVQKKLEAKDRHVVIVAGKKTADSLSRIHRLVGELQRARQAQQHQYERESEAVARSEHEGGRMRRELEQVRLECAAMGAQLGAYERENMRLMRELEETKYEGDEKAEMGRIHEATLFALQKEIRSLTAGKMKLSQENENIIERNRKLAATLEEQAPLLHERETLLAVNAQIQRQLLVYQARR